MPRAAFQIVSSFVPQKGQPYSNPPKVCDPALCSVPNPQGLVNTMCVLTVGGTRCNNVPFTWEEMSQHIPDTGLDRLHWWAKPHGISFPSFGPHVSYDSCWEYILAFESVLHASKSIWFVALRFSRANVFISTRKMGLFISTLYFSQCQIEGHVIYMRHFKL